MLKSFLNHIKNFDWIMIGAAVLLVFLGLISIYSSSLRDGDFSNFYKQLIFLGIGLVAMVGISLFDFRLVRNDPYFILFLYGLGIVAIAGLFVFAPEIRGVKGWYKIGGFSIDPLEYMKIVMVILMAKYFSMRHIEMYRIQHILLSGIYFSLPIALAYFKPDFGSIILLSVLWLVTLLVSGIKIKHLLALLMIGAVLFFLGWNVFLHDYQKERIMSFIEPNLDPLGSGWSQLQSRIAIGNAGILGQGVGQGTQTQYGFLSEPQTDFIFAALSEELGLLAILPLFALFAILLWRIIRLGINAEHNFPRLFAVGFATLIIIQFFINIGMNVGLLPIIGLPLHFVSYGGSSLIMSFAALGILQGIKTRA